MGALGLFGQTEPAGLPVALLWVFGAVLFFAGCGLAVSAAGAFRRWRARRRFYS